MAAKPETGFSQAINKHVHKLIYRVKISNPYTSGVPDFYYDGARRDLWVEYKFTRTGMPKILDLTDQKKKVCLSLHQLRWLKRRYEVEKNAVVMYGCKEGVLLLQNRTWELPVHKDDALGSLLTRKEAAEWIERFVGIPSRNLSSLQEDYPIQVSYRAQRGGSQ